MTVLLCIWAFLAGAPTEDTTRFQVETAAGIAGIFEKLAAIENKVNTDSGEEREGFRASV